MYSKLLIVRSLVQRIKSTYSLADVRVSFSSNIISGEVFVVTEDGKVLLLFSFTNLDDMINQLKAIISDKENNIIVRKGLWNESLRSS